MANLMAETTSKASGENSEFKNKILNSEHQLEKLAQNAGERVGAMASDFANTTADKMKSSREYVKENPVKCVAIATATGLVVGSLLTIVMRSRKH
jgi:ElaB/YqjD/DUF883 family membrane-anchored ribosome-binding protein